MDEAGDETPPALRSGRGIGERAAELAQVLGHGFGHRDGVAFGVELAEVGKVLLRRAELGRRKRESRAVKDRALYEG